ncbi:MAG: hypothetical protein AMDU4_FER2C00274G0003 [Ferroplasma sp. Type II]|nr:MAG: hypothetical protein AMDU4_FER2C00274G0003 [Ferroplasma sp. Type II]
MLKTSLYLQLNSMINTYNKNDTFKELITLHDINVDLNDIKTLLTMRYDSMNDDRIIVGMEFKTNSSLDIY